MSETAKVQAPVDPLSQEAFEQRLDDLEKAELPADVNLVLLWETLSHCTEPGDANIVLEKLEVETAHLSLEKAEKKAAEEEHTQGRYRIKFDGRGFPERHPTWPEAFQLHVDEKEHYFYVLQSSNAKVSEDDSIYPTEFAPGDVKTRSAQFGYRYECGKRAHDANGHLLGEENDQIEFNYAEHKMIGEMLSLKWSKTESTPGTKELNLPNGVKLTYGEINGLGGDFFGGYHPICTGGNFGQQCEYFEAAFDTLGKSGKAVNEVSQLRDNRKEEVEAIAKAVNGGESTFKAYKSLKKPGKTSFISKEDEDLTLITLKGDAPSYLILAQMNLDHFGEDAVTAYNAGHYCALKKAAEGSLETAYAMNAFADHYLGDCFASGHIRVPRRELHNGSRSAFGVAWTVITGLVQHAAAGNLTSFYQGAMKLMIPDLCTMLMHNEDNKRGLTVTNKKGDEFTCWGDKQMFEEQNKANKEMMRQGLQASVDEVYEAFESKKAKRPEDGYRPWNYAPYKVVEEKSHSPLFIKYEPSKYHPWKYPVKVRTPFHDPHSKKYEEVGGASALIDLYNKINTSDLWKQY